MFTGISWQSYLLVVAASAAIYYFYVAIHYFRNDLTTWLANKTNGRSASKTAVASRVQTHTQQTETITAADETTVTSASEYDELDHLIGRVNKTINDAAIRKAEPSELQGYLALVFREYPSLKNDGMRPAINELVASECAKHNIPISEAEADRLWEQA